MIGHLFRVISDVGSFAPLPQQQADHGSIDEQEQAVPPYGNPKRLRSVELKQDRQSDPARGVSSEHTDGRSERDGKTKYIHSIA